MEGLGELALERGLRLNPDDLAKWGLAAGENVKLIVDGKNSLSPAKADSECPAGVAYLTHPVNFGGLSDCKGFESLYGLESNPIRVSIRAVESNNMIIVFEKPALKKHLSPGGRDVSIIERRMIVPNLHEFVVEAPEVARSVQPGNFVIVRPDENGERVPLSVADWDREAGTVTVIFMQVGASTAKLARLKPGDTIPTFAGPLGRETEIENFGTVLCIGGCYGIGSVYPIARALKEKGNTVYIAPGGAQHLSALLAGTL